MGGQIQKRYSNPSAPQKLLLDITLGKVKVITLKVTHEDHRSWQQLSEDVIAGFVSSWSDWTMWVNHESFY